MSKKNGPLSQKLVALLEQRTAMQRLYFAMRPGKKKSEATVALTRLDRDIKRLRARIAGHGHRKA